MANRCLLELETVFIAKVGSMNGYADSFQHNRTKINSYCEKYIGDILRPQNIILPQPFLVFKLLHIPFNKRVKLDIVKIIKSQCMAI
jgi:hypothetical protein